RTDEPAPAGRRRRPRPRRAVPHDHRAALLGGTTTAAIARAMQVPVATVRTRVRRALAVLRDRLDRTCGDRAAWTAVLASGAEETAAVTGSASTPTATTVPTANLVLAGALF